MRSGIAIAVGIFYSAWFLLSILNNLNYSWFKRVIRWDIFHLLPRWTFFAPNPGTNDFHLVYRCRGIDMFLSEFKEITLIDTRTVLTAIWNPQKRVKKALSDLVNDIRIQSSLQLPKDIREANIKLSFSYIAILNFLSREMRKERVEAFQFAIIQSSGFISFKEPELILCSDFHNV